MLEATERALTLARDEADDDALLRSVGSLTAERVYTPARAIEVHQELYRRHADEAPVREALVGLLRREARYTQLDAWFQAELGRLAQQPDATAERIRLLHARAELLRGPLDDTDAAERCYRDVLALDPDDEPTRAGLETLLRIHERHKELATLLAEKASRAQTPTERVDALRDEAQVHQALGDEPAAIERLEAAIAALDASVSVGLKARTLRAVVHLLRNQQRWEELAGSLDDCRIDGHEAVRPRLCLHR